MSTVTLRIQVDKSGAPESIGKVKSDLQGMGAAGAAGGAQAAGGMDTLKGAINGARAAVATFVAAYAAIQTLGVVVRMADEYQGLSDRLRLATGSTEEFNTAQAGVFAIAQSTGSALTAVGALYVSLANSTKQLGLNQGELLTITEAINQSFVVSGTSASSAEAATRQLGQAFASGVLRGDEFNSMMENAPGLASALATSLGVNTGELRKMAAAGELTSEVLAQGLLKQAPAIAAQFDAMGLTVGRAFQQLSNSVLRFVGEASQASGAGAALASVISGLANNLPAFVALLTAAAAGYGTLAAAAAVANPAIGFTGTLLAGLATALGVVVVAYSAYKLGEYLTNEFEIVRAAGANLVIYLNAAWNVLKTGAIAAFVGIKIAFASTVDQIQENFADLLDDIVKFSEVDLGFGLHADFAYGEADAFKALSSTLRDATDASKLTDDATEALAQQVEFATKDSSDFSAQMLEGVAAHFATKGAINSNTDSHKALAPAVAKSKDELKALKDAMDAAKRAASFLTDEQIRLSGELGGPLVAAAIETAQRMNAITKAEEDMRRAGTLTAAQVTINAGLQRQIADAFEATRLRLGALETATQSYLRELKEDIRLAGLSGTARQNAEIRINAEATARRLLTGATNDQVAALADEITALGLQKKAAEDSGAAADQWADYWNGAVTSVTDAFGDFVAGGLKDFGSFADSLKNTAKKIMADLISIFAKRILLNFGGGATGAFGGILGQLFGSAGGAAGGIGLGGGGGLLGGAAGAAGGTAAISGSGLGTALYGVPVIGWIAAAAALNNSLFSQGWQPANGDKPAGFAYQSANIITGFTPMLSGIADRLLRGLGLSDRTASLLSGSAVVQRLFGRSAPQLTGATTTTSFGADGVGVSQLLSTLERGGVFRSDRRRTRTGELDDSAVDAAQQLFDDIEATMTNAARMLQGTAPDMIAAAFRVVQTFDSDGKIKATKYFVEALGRSWEEASAEAAISRINSEALIATIDSVLGSTVDSAGLVIGNAVVDVLDEAGNVIGTRFVGVGDDIIKGVERLGEASAIAERWRDDAASLADGAQFLLAAATDIRAGVGLLGQGGTLTAITDLTESLRVGQESLVTTYTRLRVGTLLLDSTLHMLGGSFRGTSAQAVGFANDLINLSGGLDQFSSLLDSALTALFTEAERNQFTADQAQTALNSALAGLSISGTGLESIRTQLRTQLRAAMEAGNAALTDQLLRAGRALGLFSSALGALGDNAVLAAADMNFGSNAITKLPDGPRDPNQSDKPRPGQAPTTQLGATLQAGAILGTHTVILQEIAANTKPDAAGVANPRDKATRDTADATRDMKTLLRDILAALEASNRDATINTLKATISANGRKAVRA